PELRHALALLRAWVRSGAHRIDRNRDGAYDQSEAVQIMDAWWPRWLHAEFEPLLGRRLFRDIAGLNELVNAPNNSGQHLGSAWQAGWYGYAQKDLRTVLGRHVRGRYSRVYCGRGSLARCRTALAASLRAALRHDTPAELASGGLRTRGLNLRAPHPRRAAVTRRSAPAEHEGPSSVVRPSSCPELATHTVVKSGLLRVGRSHRVAGAERGCDGMSAGGSWPSACGWRCRSGRGSTTC